MPYDTLPQCNNSVNIAKTLNSVHMLEIVESDPVQLDLFLRFRLCLFVDHSEDGQKLVDYL